MERETLSVASGAHLVEPMDVAYSEARRELIVAARDLHALVAVRVQKFGLRTVLSGEGEGQGAGPPFRFLSAVAVDHRGRRALAADLSGVLDVDLATGDRRLFHTELLSARAIIYAKGERSAYLISNDGLGVYALDLQTGGAMKIYTASPGAEVVDLAVQPHRDPLLILTADNGVSELDVAGGSAVEIARIRVDLIFETGTPRSIEVSPDGKRALILSGRMIAVVELETSGAGGRAVSPVSVRSSGGIRFFDPTAMSIDWRRNVGYVADFSLSAVYAVELGSGARAIVSR